MQGVLFRYGPDPAQVAFRSTIGAGGGGAGPSTPAAAAPAAAANARRHLVLVAGLTEGLLALPYAQPLAEAAAAAGYELVQAQLTSSYIGWGVGSLDSDAEELRTLARHLAAEQGSAGFVLMGHSTGCQDAVRYCQKLHRAAGGGGGASSGGEGEGSLAAPLEGVILQAPASDREFLEAYFPELTARLPEAKVLIAAGKADDVICRAPAVLGAAPLSAARLVALGDRLGDDDMFSMDLTPEELRSIHAPLAPYPLLVLQSGSDECVADPATIPVLGARILAAAGPAPAPEAGPSASAAAAAVPAPAGAGSSGGSAAGAGSGAKGTGGAEGEPGAAGRLRRHVVIPGAPHNAAGHEGRLAKEVADVLMAVAAARGAN